MIDFAFFIDNYFEDYNKLSHLKEMTWSRFRWWNKGRKINLCESIFQIKCQSNRIWCYSLLVALIELI